jgi:hypothetical protein
LIAGRAADGGLVDSLTNDLLLVFGQRSLGPRTLFDKGE